MNDNKKISAFPVGVRESVRELGELISCARKERRWSQEELARRIGVSRMTVVRMEKGSPEIATGWYLTAAWILGLPVLSWQNPAERKNDTVVADFLAKLKRTLPNRVGKPRKRINNDF